LHSSHLTARNKPSVLLKSAIERKGEKLLGFDIIDFDKITTLEFDNILITAEKSIGTAAENLIKMGVSRSKISTLE